MARLAVAVEHPMPIATECPAAASQVIGECQIVGDTCGLIRLTGER